MNQKVKKCTYCKKEKAINLFYNQKSSKDGKQSQCKNCLNKKVKFYNQENKTEKSKYNKNYWQINKKKLKIQNKNYIQNNFKKRALYKHNYWIKNKHWISPLNTIKCRERRRNDLEYRIICNLRNRIYCVIERNYKSLKTKELLGCEIDFFLKHLESQFTVGMNWENYGLWHVDHIQPFASINMTILKNQRKLCHWSNCQPLWNKDNLSKGNKWNETKK